MLRRNGPVVKSVESVLRLEGSLWGERFVEEVRLEPGVKERWSYGWWEWWVDRVRRSGRSMNRKDRDRGVEMRLMERTGWNPGFGFVFFQLHSVHFNSRSCNSLMCFALVIIHKLSKRLFPVVSTDPTAVTAMRQYQWSARALLYTALSSLSWTNVQLLLQFSCWHTGPIVYMGLMYTFQLSQKKVSNFIQYTWQMHMCSTDCANAK